MTVKIYGIKNCDTIKKACKWLDTHQVSYEFHDYRKQGCETELVERFFSQLDWQQVVNKRGTTYRQLTDEQKQQLSPETAVSLLVEAPAMIKRPILECDGKLHLGFKEAEYQALFANS